MEIQLIMGPKLGRIDTEEPKDKMIFFKKLVRIDRESFKSEKHGR